MSANLDSNEGALCSSTRPVHFCDLPDDVFQVILQHLRPLEPLTTRELTSKKLEIQKEHVDSRYAFASLSLVSRRIRPLATTYLYRYALVRSPRELVFFFRTIASDDALRHNVQSFAWVGVLSARSSETFPLIGCTNTPDPAMRILADLDWPLNAKDVEIANFMGVGALGSMENWRLLGVVLGMISKVKALFLSVDAKASPRMGKQYDEIDSIYTLLGPSGSQDIFLQQLKTLFLELPWSTVRHGRDIQTKLLGPLFANSRALRRVEVKRMTYSKEKKSDSMNIWELPVYPVNVKELLVIDTKQCFEGMIGLAELFPSLASLELEYNGEFPVQYQLERRIERCLSQLSESLETLLLTTNPKHIFSQPWLFRRPCLSGLPELAKLKHLTTESVWLFGRNNIFDNPQLPYLLPASLETLTLVDYWGSQAGVEHYYPECFGDMSTLEFYDGAFTAVHQVHKSCFPHLKYITLALPVYYYPQMNAIVDAGTGEVRKGDGECVGSDADIVAFLLKFQALFASIGVQFSLTTPERITKEVRSSWARIR